MRRRRCIVWYAQAMVTQYLATAVFGTIDTVVKPSQRRKPTSQSASKPCTIRGNYMGGRAMCPGEFEAVWAAVARRRLSHWTDTRTLWIGAGRTSRRGPDRADHPYSLVVCCPGGL